MSLLGNIKGRLDSLYGADGSGRNDFDGYEEYGEYDADYDPAYDDTYDAPSGGLDSLYAEQNDASYAQNSPTQSRRSRRLNSLLAPRARYQLDDHAPLISAGDVRAQNVPELKQENNSYVSGDARRDDEGFRRVGEDLRRAGDDLPRAADNLSCSEDDFSRAGEEFRRIVEAPRRAIQNSRRAGADASASPLSTTASIPHVSATPSGVSQGELWGDTPDFYASRSGQVKARAVTGNFAAQSFRQLIIVRPVAYSDAEKVTGGLKEGSAVAVDLRATRPELAKRILDFAFGAARALGGQVEMPANRVYAITIGIPLTPEENEQLAARGIS